MKTLIKFKSMQEILLSDGGTFDQHGNIHCCGEHLAPSYFCRLGQLQEMPAHHSFPTWCIEKEYRDDALPANAALRILARELNKEGNESLQGIADRALNGGVTLVYRSN